MMGHAWLKHREALLAVVIILMIGAIGSRAPSFVSPGNLVEMFNDTAILIILALGQMMVLLTKGIDLSMAANLALTGMIVALINAHYPGIPVVALLALATLLGLLMGVINGLLVWRLGIPAIVVTLGTMSIYRGIIFLLTDGGWVNSHQMSADFLSLPRSPLLGLPLLSWCAIAALLLVGYFLRYSRTGRALYTAGGNATAAYYTGINAGKMQFVSFCLSGALAGFCGYLWISRFAVAYVDVANGFELQVVAACVIGGISTMGGSGRVLGCLCGLFNGLLVTRFNLSSIVITIGTMSLYRGITYILLGDQALNHYPESFAWFGQGYVWGALSFEFALFILLAAAFTFLLHKTNFGRRTYAIGNNPTGAWFSGINVKRHNLVLFALVGLMAGLAAVLLTSRLGSTRPTLAMGWELAVVTMAVLGGVNILGGSGSMPGVIIAAFLMGLVTFGLSLLNVPGIVMSVIIGAMLIVVISLPIITRRMMQRRRC